MSSPVLEAYRALGAGGLPLEALLARARQRGFAEAVLSARLHAIPFYARYGFVAEGEVYLDARMPHRTSRNYVQSEYFRTPT